MYHIYVQLRGLADLEAVHLPVHQLVRLVLLPRLHRDRAQAPQRSLCQLHRSMRRERLHATPRLELRHSLWHESLREQRHRHRSVHSSHRRVIKDSLKEAPVNLNLFILSCPPLSPLGVPLYLTTMKKLEETAGIMSQNRYFTPPEQDYVLLPYNSVDENIRNFMDATIQFGYTTMFITALPMSLFFSLCANYLKTKVNVWRLTTIYQRPLPFGAEDIGTWQGILQLISVISVITNAGLICFTMRCLNTVRPYNKVW